MADTVYSAGIAAIFDVVARLRAPDGCPWDREQTHESLRPYLLEETYEVLEAIDSADDAKLREELGDLLLQVAMHAEIASQEGRFDAVSVSEGVAAKMVSRHPHVFGDATAHTAEDVLRNWESSKSREAAAAGRASESVIDRVPRSLPALAWVHGMLKRAARVGHAVEPSDSPAMADPFTEIGDRLFDLVALARVARVNPEDALRSAGQRFAKRFKEENG